jgi:hypothetical protein
MVLVVHGNDLQEVISGASCRIVGINQLCQLSWEIECRK